MDEAIRRTRRGITVKLEMTQKQELKLTPQMLQSMEILQMSTQELEAYLQELVQENPAAELSEPEERPDEGEELWRRMQSLADQDNQNRQYVAAEREELDPLARIGTDGGLEDTLLLHLSRQLERSQAPTLVLRGAQFLAACLDEAGYLREKVENLAQAAGLPAAVLEEGLSLLQTLDPARVTCPSAWSSSFGAGGRRGPPWPSSRGGWSGWPGGSTGPSPRSWASAGRRCSGRRRRSGRWIPGRGPPLPPVRSRSIWSRTWWCSRGSAGWRSICRRAACLVSASAASTAICTGTIRTRRSASIWTGRSGRPSGPSRRWNSAAPPCSGAPRCWSGGRRRFSRVPGAA